MTMTSLKLFRVAVPLKKVVRHASFERSVSENLVVRVTLDDGSIGYGEGVPRSYVTGETLETAFATLEAHDWARLVGRPTDYGQLVATLASLTLPENESDPRGMAGNSARSALELALLDAYGRRFGEPVGRAVELAQIEGLKRFPKPRWVRYSAAITAESARGEAISAWKIGSTAFPRSKSKLGPRVRMTAGGSRGCGGSSARESTCGLMPTRRGERTSCSSEWRPLRQFNPSALEQPVPHAEVGRLAELRPLLGIPIMLDESLCGYPDAQAAVDRRTADLLNVRLSKCGGILASLRIIALAQRSGLGVQLGCHPGETSLLSAAGRHVASRVAGLRYVEGSYDRHILAANLTNRDLTFGYGGRARPLLRAGARRRCLPGRTRGDDRDEPRDPL